MIRLLISCALAASGPAAFAKAKPEKDDSVEAQLKFKENDEAGNDAKALGAEILIEKSEKKALTQLQRLAKKNAGKAVEPDLLFRLAELYMRRARSERFFEAHRGSEMALKLAPEVVQDASEKAEIQRAISMYEDLQARFPRFHSLDIVIFNEAFAREQLGQMDQAETLFAKIPDRFPHSSVAPDSWLALGEISYQRRQYSTANDRFLKVKQYPDARAYPYALYKAAWCKYNLQDAASGLKQLEEVVAFGRDAARDRRDAKLDLRKEALGDMALFFSDSTPASEAVSYFERQAGDLDPAPYLMRLVEIYKRHSKYAEVESVLKKFLAAHPDSEHASSAREELVWNYERALKRADAVAELERFELSCGELKVKAPTKKSKKAADAAAMDPRAQCRAKVADAAKKLAGKWHALWKRRAPVDELAASAERAYALYFRAAPSGDADGATARYAYGELLFQRGKNREASAQYALVAAEKPAQPLAHDAAYAAIVALEKAVEPNKWADSDERRFVELADAFLKGNSNGAYALDVRFKRGFIAYEKERFDEAGEAFKKIGWGPYPMGPKVAKAQDLWLDILNLRKDFKGLKENARGLLTRADLDPERKAAIEKIYRQAYFAEIQGLEEKGKDKDAIGAYKAFAVENQSSDLAPKAWWNASQLLFKIGDAEGGASACYQMHKMFPTAPNAKDCLTKSAQTFEAMGKLDLAARVLLNLALVDQPAEEKWRETAADFFALSGSRSRAATMYEKLAEGKPAARKLQLEEKLQSLAKTAKDMDAYRKSRARIVALGVEPQASDAAIEELEESVASGAIDQTEAFSRSRKLVGHSGASKATHARARLIQAEILEDEFSRQSVKARPERLAMVLAMKTEKLEKAQSAFQSTIKFGDARTSAMALRRLARSYRSYAEAIRAIPTPEGANAKDAESFRGELERLATPMEEKGVESLAQAVEAAKKANARDGLIGEIQAELDKANMKKPTPAAPAPTVPGPYVPRFTSATIAANGGPR